MSKRASKKESKVEVVFVLDRSGSMTGMEDDTIGGFNSMLQKQQKEGGEIIWSTVLFDDMHEVIHDRVPIDKVKPLTEDEYYTRGTTALLDAVGRAVRYIKRAHKIEKGNAPEKTLFVITTDGYENASKEFTYGRVKKMIEDQQEEHGWEFIFLGANIDAVSEAGKIGVRASRAARYINDGDGIEKNFDALHRSIDVMRSCERLDDGCLDDIRKDYNRRRKTVPAENGAKRVSRALQPKTCRRVRARSLKDYLE